MDKSNNLFNKIIKLFVISIILIMLDAFTKAWAESALSDSNINIIKDFFYLSLVHNNGAAFGILENSRIFFCTLTILLAIIIEYVYFKLPNDKIYTPLRYDLILLFAGAIGNLVDRIKNGYVIDFLAFDFGNYSFPRFNVADIYVCVSAFLLFLLVMFYYNEEQLSGIIGRKEK